MILTKNNKYEGEFVSVEVNKDNRETTLTVFGRYDKDREYLILGEKKTITLEEYLEFVKEEIETIKVMIGKDYGKQN